MITMNYPARVIKSELIQIRPTWHASPEQLDLNRWSRVHPRALAHDGCIIDLGCLGWNRDFHDKTSDNWAGFFFGKKRVIGVDPQELPHPQAEFFKGFISDFSGHADLVCSGLGAQLWKNPYGQHEVLTWTEFKEKFNINAISILKINIEGGEWDLIDSLEPSDFQEIDQICISFHDFLSQFSDRTRRTKDCIDKIVSQGFDMVDLEMYGWKMFLKRSLSASLVAPLAERRSNFSVLAGNSKEQIPRLLHVIWIGDESKCPHEFIESWREMNPSFQLRIWGNSDLKQVRWMLDQAINKWLPKEINGAADLMRWEILFKHGGIALDADSLCVRPLPDWILEPEVFATWENEVMRPGLIACGALGAKPRHPFICQIINDILSDADIAGDLAWKKVGPGRITMSWRESKFKNLTIFPSHFFIPDHYTGVKYTGGGAIFARQAWGSTKLSYGNLKIP